MKIKGVTAGVNRGQIIHLNPREKAFELLKAHIPTMSDDGLVWWAEKIEIGDVQNSKGRPNEKGYPSDIYNAQGKYLLRKVKDGKLQPLIPYTFNMRFKDIIDPNGMPDLEMTEFINEGV